MPSLILSLDGGGIRGVAVVQFLKRLESILDTPIHELFDTFIGTSVGGLIAIKLASGDSVGDCVDFCTRDNMMAIMDKSWWDKITPVQFSPKYDGTGIKEVVGKYIKKIPLNKCKKKLLITGYNLNKHDTRIFKSAVDDIDLQTLGLITSAAPTYFPCIEYKGEWYMDGGIGANNPTMVSYVDATEGKDDFKILSIGTGFKNVMIDGEQATNWGVFEWLKHNIANIAFDAPLRLIDRNVKKLLGKRYLRIDGVCENMCMDDTSIGNVKALRRMGDEWFEKNEDKLREFFVIKD